MKISVFLEWRRSLNLPTMITATAFASAIVLCQDAQAQQFAYVAKPVEYGSTANWPCQSLAWNRHTSFSRYAPAHAFVGKRHREQLLVRPPLDPTNYGYHTPSWRQLPVTYRETISDGASLAGSTIQELPQPGWTPETVPPPSPTLGKPQLKPGHTDSAYDESR